MTPESEGLQQAGLGFFAEWIWPVVYGDRLFIVQMITSHAKDNVQKIITKDLGMWKLCTKTVPRLVNDDQKEFYIKECQEIIKRLQTEPDLLQRVISSYETAFCVQPSNQQPEQPVRTLQCCRVRRKPDIQTQNLCWSHFSKRWTASKMNSYH